MKGVEVRSLETKSDERGWVTEIIRKEELIRTKEFGQIMITAAHPGYVKGNHYHTRKCEWYCVVKGEARLVLLDMRTGEQEELALSESKLTLVRIPPQVSHAIENVGKEMMQVLIYIDEPYDQKDPDTFHQKVL